MDINWNRAQPGAIDWSKYAHVMIEADAVTGAAISELYPLDIENAILNPDSVTYYAVYGLGLDGAYTLLHQADTLTEAQTAVSEGIAQINTIHTLNKIAPVVLKRGFWDMEINPDHYDDVESRGLSLCKLDDGSHCYEETDQEHADCFSVYGHVTDPEIGGCECLATVYSVAEMAQLSKIIDVLLV